jgi:hypothetical protein
VLLAQAAGQVGVLRAQAVDALLIVVQLAAQSEQALQREIKRENTGEQEEEFK